MLGTRAISRSGVESIGRRCQPATAALGEFQTLYQVLEGLTHRRCRPSHAGECRYPRLPFVAASEVVDTGIRRHDWGHRQRVDHSDTRYYLPRSIAETASPGKRGVRSV